MATSPHTVRLRVAGLTLTLAVPAGLPLPRLDPAALRFRAARGADIRLTLAAVPPPTPREEGLLFDSGQVWRTYRYRRGLLYTFRIPGRRPPVYKAVAIDRRLEAGTVYVPPSPEGPDASAALEFPLDEILFQHRLARAGAMEVHACGVKADGGVALFCGKSGSGKTTMARLWRRYAPHATVLSDDRIVVRDQGGRLRAYGTPWHGEAGFADPGSGPIRSVFFLRHARRGRLERLAAPAAAARLFARTFPPLWNRKAAGSVLRTCCRAAREIPCYDFGFRPDRTAVEAVMQVF